LDFWVPRDYRRWGLAPHPENFNRLHNEGDNDILAEVFDLNKCRAFVGTSPSRYTVAEYYKPYGEYGDGSYAPGDIIEVYDLKQRLRCIIKATKVYTVEFGNVPEEVWRGEAFSSAEEFRECHIRCLPHLDLHDHFELVTLHFELVEVIAREVAD
jgi:uncharacterized protein YhfF